VSVRRFRFRAQAALDLRQREHDRALRVMTHLEADLRTAERGLTLAETAVTQARDSYAAVMQSTSASAEQQWYRSWIVRRDRERAAAARAVAARRLDYASARTAYDAARQKLEALDRLKERAREQWAADIAAAEQKDLDALATMRYVADKGDKRDYAND
jgi:flagellar export protein FliJ